MLAWSRDVGEGLDELRPEQRKEVLQMVVDEVTVDRENNLDITLAIPIDDESVSIASQPSPPEGRGRSRGEGQFLNRLGPYARIGRFYRRREKIMPGMCDGLRVIEVSQGMAGGLAGMILGRRRRRSNQSRAPLRRPDARPSRLDHVEPREEERGPRPQDLRRAGGRTRPCGDRRSAHRRRAHGRGAAGSASTMRLCPRRTPGWCIARLPASVQSIAGRTSRAGTRW